jgi:hypothetical protein
VLPVPGIDKALMIASVLFVLDRRTAQLGGRSGHRPHFAGPTRLSKRAKDIGSAAVLIALINVPAVWAWCAAVSCRTAVKERQSSNGAAQRRTMVSLGEGAGGRVVQ